MFRWRKLLIGGLVWWYSWQGAYIGHCGDVEGESYYDGAGDTEDDEEDENDDDDETGDDEDDDNDDDDDDDDDNIDDDDDYNNDDDVGCGLGRRASAPMLIILRLDTPFLSSSS